MPFDISQFRATLSGSGARPNLFQVELTFPPSAPNGLASTNLTFMAKAASIPPDHLGTYMAYYFGRELKYPGDRRFEPWTIQIYNDENYVVRTAFEKWMSSLNEHVANIRDESAGTIQGYQVDATIRQYAKTGEDLQDYKMIGCWPSDVTPMEMDWESADSMESFQVTLAYQWWENINSTDLSGI